MCSGNCITVNSLTVYYDNGATSATLAIDNPNLTWDIPAGVTFVNGQLCGDIGTYTIGVTYLDECNSITEATGSVEITFELCCLIPELSDLSFKIKLQGVWTEFITAFSPNITSYDIYTDTSGAPKFEFIGTSGCDTLKLEFNWYRGYNCGNSWLVNDPLTAEIWYDAEHDETLNIPGWREIVSEGVYPSNNENTLCTHGGNILLIKVTASDGSSSKIYRVDIYRSN